MGTMWADAAKENDLPRVLQLVQLGAPLELRDANNGFTALHWACYRRRDRVTKALLEISLRMKLPVLHEVIVAQTEEQARERCLGTTINRGTEAARAAVRMLQTLDAIRGTQR